MTTVGYGDIYPRTNTGRAIALILMIACIGFVALLAGALAQRFIGLEIEEELEKVKEELVVDIDAARADLQRELREIGRRIHALEEAIARLR